MPLATTLAPYARYWPWIGVLAVANVVFGVGDAAMGRWGFAVINAVCAVAFGVLALRLRTLHRENTAL